MQPIPSSDVRRVSVREAMALLNAAEGVLVDTRDARLYENLHAADAISLPLGASFASLPPDRLIILYCA